MNKLAKAASLDALGLPKGDHWVRFHVDEQSISFEIAASIPEKVPRAKKPTGFVQRWGGTAKKIDDESDSWLSHINEKHLK